MFLSLRRLLLLLLLLLFVEALASHGAQSRNEVGPRAQGLSSKRRALINDNAHIGLANTRGFHMGSLGTRPTPTGMRDKL